VSEIGIQNEHKNMGIEELEEPIYIRKGWLGFPWVFWGVVFLYGVSIILYGFKLGWVPSVAVADWGKFGDFFGGFINPIVGLVTIVLFAASLKQNQIAISHSEQTLIQNEKILKATLDELKITRQTAEAGQAIQAATEKALKQQIEISVHEKHFNTVLALKEKYEKFITEFEKGAPDFAVSEVEVGITRRRLNFLSRYIDSNFNEVIEKAMASGIDPAKEFAGKLIKIENTFYNLTAMAADGYVRIDEGWPRSESYFYWNDHATYHGTPPKYLDYISRLHNYAEAALRAFTAIPLADRDGDYNNISGLSSTPKIWPVTVETDS
jgi:hypothetical protein